MKKPIVAIMYDFDKTLITRDMQEYTFIPSLGMQPDDFWAGTQTLASEQQMDSVLAYMYAMMTRAEANGKPLKREDLVECGQHVVYLPGVEGWFERINEYGKEAGVEVEHYVLSSGLKEIIDGTSIAKHFKKIFASEFLYGEDGKAIWAKMAVNYTNKTQFVYRINKGVLDISNNADVNASTPESDRRVFFNNMIYLGDGLTDVPCMKLVKLSGGHSIALYQDGQKEKVQPLLKHERVDWIFQADYREGQPLDVAMKNLIYKLGVDNTLITLSNDQKKETPDMVPYCNLPESQKLYDREMAMQTLKLVKKLGFEIKKIQK